MRRLILTLPFLVLLCLPVSAGAAYEHRMLSVSEPELRSCVRDLGPGAAGTARTSWTAPAEGYLNARLSGGLNGDWDIAVLGQGGGEPLAVSTSFGSNEQATTWVERGDELTIQACRREGGVERIPLSLDLTEMQIPGPTDETFTLERVALDGPATLQDLEATGLDVTHAATEDSAIVATYSDEERAELTSAGFTYETVEDDLLAKDLRSRQIEQRATAAPGASELPSGNEAYRTYPDYTNDMKALVDDYPGLVRKVIVGETFEGRTIQGVEIAKDVEADDDGRPVYLNMALHHAREWPGGEFTMEYAIDLAERYGSDPEVTELLDNVRVVLIPVVNVDGFIASRSFGTSPLDDNVNANLPQIVANQGAYIRKNCRPTLNDGAVPCANRTGSGVDPNRNYGAYWGGEGASTDPSSQGYRGTGPFSEPETNAMRKFMSKLNPAINVTNHTFTEEGQWLYQPGFEFDEITDPDGDGVHEVPDQEVHKEIGDAMAAATGWEANKSTILGSITGATEDWNYYVQGAYGFTPEGRGPNFHGTFANAVVTEYEGDATHQDQGVFEAFMRAGEIASRPANLSIVKGAAPAGATLKLERDFKTPVFEGEPIDDHLEITLTVPKDGTYNWQVGPSSRPLESGEAYTMTCRRPGGEKFSTEVIVDRGEVETVDWETNNACGKKVDPPQPQLESCKAEDVTLRGTSDGEQLRGTKGDDVIKARGGNDKIRGRGGDDVICAGGGKDEVRANGGDDSVQGGDGRDNLKGGSGNDALAGGPDKDKVDGGSGTDNCPGPRKREDIKRCE
jgi:murein tripeptide amidase MpaA